MTQEGVTERVAIDRYGIIRRLRAAIYGCADSLRRSKEFFYDRLDPFRLMKANKYAGDVTFAVQHDCRRNPLVVIIACQFACGPTDWER